ncbi:MAG: fibronectin type III domain-containing protein [Clostridiales bacterium]|nr:fibronectin type III domain-containing protein [Clostridiales bacterium]
MFHDQIYDGVKQELETQIRSGVEQEFHDQIFAGIEANLRQTYYENAIRQIVYDQAYNEALKAMEVTEETATEEQKAEAQSQANAAADNYMTENADAIAADAAGFVTEKFGEEAAAQLSAGADAFIEDAETNGIEVDPENAPGVKMTVEEMTQNELTSDVKKIRFTETGDMEIVDNGEGDYTYQETIDIIVAQQMEAAETEGEGIEVDPVNAPGYKMTIEEITQQQLASTDPAVDLDNDGNPDVTFEQAIQIYTDQAATGMTQGILGAWEGNHIGALAEGKSVCLGYARAYSYLIQCMHPEVYTTDGVDYKTASNWKTAKELYYDEEGNLDINQNYLVDVVRISFAADVVMYGEDQPEFNSDHFWNAVKVDGTWYYIDPCYTDVYPEVMSRDRVETAGYMNHLYFMFSHDTAVNLYEDNYSELKTLYADAANDKTYETSWAVRAGSNVSNDGTNFYYVYDSTDLISMKDAMGDMNQGGGNMGGNGMNDMMESMGEATRYSLVMHPMDEDDSGDGDTDYTALIEFNYSEDSEEELGVARVYNPETKEMEENELVTKLYAQHAEQAGIYPSIAITTALKDGKLYFNLSNVLLTYELSTGKVEVVKVYNTVYGTRDKTNAFGGMAFSLSETSGDFRFENHPIAGILLDGEELVVSIATNLAFISGKDPEEGRDADQAYIADSETNGYGYEFEETNYNTSFNRYFTEYSDETNDNDEFMWVANLVGKTAVSEFSAVTYDSVDDYLIQCDHHYIKFTETYYTKDDNGSWNSDYCYVCTKCNKSVVEPVDQSENTSFGDQMTEEEKEELHQKYLEEKAAYDAIEASAGHTYEPTDAEWADEVNEDGTSTGKKTVTFKNLKLSCSCPDVKAQLDCLVNEEIVSEVELETAETASAEPTNSGTCDEGITSVYSVSGRTESGYNYTASSSEKGEPGKHDYIVEFEWIKNEGDDTQDYTVKGNISCFGCSFTDSQTAAVEKSVREATCEETGANLYTATIVYEGTKYIDEKEDVTAEALGHTYGEPEWIWADDNGAVTAVFTCSNNAEHKETLAGEITVESTVEATCTEDGQTIYRASVEFNGTAYTADKTVVLPAEGHTYGEPVWDWSDDGTAAKATFTCEKDTQHVEVVTAEPAKDAAASTAATCTMDGNDVFKAVVEFNGKTYNSSKDVAVAALGHTYGEPEFQWTEAEDDKVTAKAVFTCSVDQNVLTENVTVGEPVVTGASCTEKGSLVYTGTVSLDGKNYSDTYTVEKDVLGHSYEATKFTWSNDRSICIATIGCVRCDVEDTALAEITQETIDPTCTEAGKHIYTAAAKYNGETYTDTVEDAIDALGHKFGNPEWKWADDYSYVTAVFTCENDSNHVQEISADSEKEITREATCIAQGEMRYTAEVEFQGQPYPTSETDAIAINPDNHDLSVKDNLNGTHTTSCSRCDYSKTDECVYINDICPECGAEKPESTITLADKKAAYTGNAITAPQAEVTGAAPGESYENVAYTYYTDKACTVLTTDADGAASSGKAPSKAGTYYVKAVVAADSHYKSAVSDAAKLTILPANAKISSIYNTETGVKMTWSAASGAEKYIIYRNGTKIGTTTGKKYTDTTAKAGKTYSYTIASSDAEETAIGDLAAAQSIRRLTEVTAKTVNPCYNGYITVKWSKVTGATGYKVYRKAAKETSWTLLKKIKDNTVVSYKDTKVTNGTAYQYYVVAYYGDSVSSYNVSSTAYYVSPTSISKISNSTAKKLAVTWKKNSKATGYEVQLSTKKTFSTATTVTKNITSYKTVSYTRSSLKSKTTYYVRVRAYKTVKIDGKNVKFYSSWSSTSKATTK